MGVMRALGRKLLCIVTITGVPCDRCRFVKEAKRKQTVVAVRCTNWWTNGGEKFTHRMNVEEAKRWFAIMQAGGPAKCFACAALHEGCDHILDKLSSRVLSEYDCRVSGHGTKEVVSDG